MSFRYTPLVDPGSQIRIVLLQPGGWHDGICLSFKTRDLENSSLDEDAELSYEALSYAWGSQDNPLHAYVESAVSGSLFITRNLDLALRHLRYEDTCRVLWVDALCIDQASDAEKNEQVATMGRIFSRASSVIVWIGTSQDDSDAVLDYFEYISKNVEYAYRQQAFRPSETCQNEARHLADMQQHLTITDRELMNIIALFSRPYFKRTWIRQEVACARNAMIHCGFRTMSWQSFETAVPFMSIKRYNLIGDSAHWRSFTLIVRFVFRLCWAVRRRGYQLSHIRQELSDTDCQDPRDKIYAVLALLQNTDANLGLRPDYSRPVEEVYVDAASRALRNSHNLNLIETCGIATRMLSIPSWVPDWSVALPRSEVQLSSFWSASAFISSHITSLSSKSITMAGISTTRVENIISGEFNAVVEQLGDRPQIREDVGTIRILLQFKQIPSGFERQATIVDWAELVCRAILPRRFNDDYYPIQTSYLDIQPFVAFLQQIWANEKEWTELNTNAQQSSSCYADSFAYLLDGLCFFKTADGYTGASLPGVQVGDEICVLLGCRSPIILRPTPKNQETYEVVGKCLVPGLMNGETIYRNQTLAKYRPVTNRLNEMFRPGIPYSMINTETGELKTNLAEILEEEGIKVENYEPASCVLEVLPETLKAAGIPLREFTLV